MTWKVSGHRQLLAMAKTKIAVDIIAVVLVAAICNSMTVLL